MNDDNAACQSVNNAIFAMCAMPILPPPADAKIGLIAEKRQSRREAETQTKIRTPVAAKIFLRCVRIFFLRFF